MSLSKFLDPKNDFAFKRIFGSEKNKDILIHFINDVLEFEGSAQVKNVEFLKTNQDPEIAAQKQSLVDVLCTDERGQQYIIEMQVARTQGFEKRAQYYAAKAYSRQLKDGEGYAQLKAIYFIAITDFIMFADKANYYSSHALRDKDTYSQDLKDFTFTFLELPKFKLEIDELKSLQEKWCYFFKYAEGTGEGELNKIAGGETVILRAYEELNRFSWSDAELNTYEQEEKRERDAQAILAQKFTEGKVEGIAEGENKKLKEMVHRFLAKGKSDAEIIDLMDLTQEELTRLKS